MLANAVKTTAMAMLVAIGATGATLTSASADTIRTSCYGDGCVRLQCNDFGYDCFRIGYSTRDDYYGYTPAYEYYPNYAAPSYDYDSGNDGYYNSSNDRDYYNDYDEDDYPG